MSFGRRQQPPGGAQPAPALRAAPSPPLQPAVPDVPRAHTAEAAKELTTLLLAAYQRGGTVHAETVIGAAAALAGEFTRRAAESALPQSGPRHVLGDAVNDLLLEGAAHGRPTMWTCIEQAARDAGMARNEMPDPADLLRQVTKGDGPAFPPITVPERHSPLEYSPNACVRLRPKVIDIADRLDLSRRDLAFALGMATAGLIAFTKDDLAPPIALRLAAEIMFAVARMAPLAETVG
jgi:hypothetical protein